MNAEIQWHAVGDELPDDDRIVLIWMPEANEPIWLGFRDEDGKWNDVEYYLLPKDVMAWAELPKPPEM